MQPDHWMYGALKRSCFGAFDTPPESVVGQAPYIPQVAYVTRRRAVALISLSIPVSGEPTDVQVQSDDRKFYVASTEAAVGTWRFKPALSKWQAVRAQCKISFTFDPGLDRQNIALCRAAVFS